MIAGTRKLLLTIDEGGTPPHIKPLLAEVVSAIEYGNWGEVTHSTCTAQQLEDAQDDLAEALETSETAIQEVKQTGRELVKEVESFCNSTEVSAMALVLKKVQEVSSEPEWEDDDIAELLEQIDHAEEEFVKAVNELKSCAKGKLEGFEH